jgi:hypothetical protein
MCLTLDAVYLTVSKPGRDVFPGNDGAAARPENYHRMLERDDL